MSNNLQVSSDLVYGGGAEYRDCSDFRGSEVPGGFQKVPDHQRGSLDGLLFRVFPRLVSGSINADLLRLEQRSSFLLQP